MKARNKLHIALRKKHSHVIKSEEVMHYVKGALSPISILVDAVKKYGQDEDQERKARTLKLIYSTSNRSDINIKSIARRAEMIYDKSGNPFIVHQNSKHSLIEMINRMRRLWEEKIDAESLNIQSDNDVQLGEYYVNYDSEVLETVFTEIFTNLKKHGGNYKRLKFVINKESISLTISNACKGITNSKLEELKKQITWYNSDKRPSINQRDSERFGLFIIKQYLVQMNMLTKISIDSNTIFTHSIIIKRYV